MEWKIGKIEKKITFVLENSQKGQDKWILGKSFKNGMFPTTAMLTVFIKHFVKTRNQIKTGGEMLIDRGQNVSPTYCV